MYAFLSKQKDKEDFVEKQDLLCKMHNAHLGNQVVYTLHELIEEALEGTQSARGSYLRIRMHHG